MFCTVLFFNRKIGISHLLEIINLGEMRCQFTHLSLERLHGLSYAQIVKHLPNNSMKKLNRI